MGSLGLRKTRDHNVVMLGKNVWQLAYNVDKPLVQLVKASYISADNFLFDEDKLGSSIYLECFPQSKEHSSPWFQIQVG